MAQAVFDYSKWVARYPEFASASESLATAYFAEATLYLDNSDASPEPDVVKRGLLLNMLTAHIASLNAPLDSSGGSGGGGAQLVGRITSATEGTVSVQAQLNVPAGSAEWFAQTKYGFAFWQATNYLRRFRYVPGISQNMAYRGY